MKAFRVWIAAGICLIALISLLLLAGPGNRNEASSLSPSGRGLFLSRSYLDSTASSCRLLDEHAYRTGGDCLLLAFPASEFPNRLELLELRRHVHEGGTLLFLYSTSGLSEMEDSLFVMLGLNSTEVPRDTELSFSRWIAEEKNPLKLHSPGLSEPVLISRPARALLARADDEILLDEPENRQVFGLLRKVGKGKVFLIPSESIANQRLLAAGNLEFLEKIRRRLPPEISFDEALHGLRSTDTVPEEGTPMADFLLGHFFLIYILSLLALGRRSGPLWPARSGKENAVANLLLRLGAVHRRMKHQSEAATTMLHRAGQYHHWTSIPEELALEAESLRNRDFLAFSRKLALHQKRKHERKDS